jgi:hypothetical protein
MNSRDEQTNGSGSSPAGWRRPLSRREVLALAGGAALVGACRGTTSKTSATATTTTSTTSAPPTTTTTTVAPSTTTTTLPPPVQPLTGLPLTDPALLSKPALVVKISNDPGARPQTGLNDPDIIFEAWGAGPTRFATVWHSRDLDFVGPIRSCREQDINLVGEFNRAVFACSGGNPGNLKLLRDSDLLLVTEGQGPGWELDRKRSRPHKTHADTAQLRANAGPDRTAPSQQFHYRAAEVAPSGDPMSGFDLQIQQVFVQWRYDPTTGMYLRSQAGKPHLLTDGAQVSTENVVVVWLDYDASGVDRRSPDGITTGTNPTAVFTGGKVVLGTWTRATRLDPFAFADSAAAPILLTPGRTFIELPNGGKGGFPGEDTFTPVS